MDELLIIPVVRLDLALFRTVMTYVFYSFLARSFLFL